MSRKSKKQEPKPRPAGFPYRWLAAGGFVLLGVLAFLILRPGMVSQPTVAPVITDSLAERSVVPDPSAKSCADCHQKEFQDWAMSQHASANRLVSAEADDASFTRAMPLHHGSFVTSFEKIHGAFLVTQVGPGQITSRHRAEAVIGIEPLVQYLIPFRGGRLQALDAAYDPGKHEWFDVYGDENRQPNEWGYWKNRGMNWNSQCAVCHMTGFHKNYDIPTDSYHSNWDAMGISCAQCHGPMPHHRANPQAAISPGEKLTRPQAIDNCASCHARREELTGNFQPGNRFHDHFRLILADPPGIYHPDGQVLAEDYEYGSFMMSRMGGHAGVTCLDCHNPHSGKLLVPLAQGNMLCLSCHASGKRGAPVVNTLAHTHHPAGSRGSLCVECHMPEHRFMARDMRRDHGFTIPDPVLTKELKIPNACNACHTGKSEDWAIHWTDRWYGAKMQRRSRKRARLIARAQRGDTSILGDLLHLARSEDIPAWRAALVALLAPWANRPNVHGYLVERLKDESPLTRSAAVRALAQTSNHDSELAPMRRDPARLVRLDAERATLGTLDLQTEEHAELLEYLNTIADQPVGALHQAELAFAEHRPEDAVAWGARLAAWDASSGMSREIYGRMLATAGHPKEAEAAFDRAVELEPDNADAWFTLALFYAGQQRLPDAVGALEKAVAVRPDFGRAWYNLGLARSQANQLPSALYALQKAETLMPNSPEPAYAAATLYLRQHDIAQARRAAQRALKIAPDFPPARRLLQEIDQHS